MTKETNLEQIKDVALQFLYLEPEPNPTFSFVVAHPFFDSPIFPILQENKRYKYINILSSTEELEEARQYLKQKIQNASDVYQILHMIRKADKRTFFKYIQRYLSVEEYGQLLRDVWTQTEFPHFDINVKKSEFLSYFKKAKPKSLMDAEEMETYLQLPDTITIYRGIHTKKYYPALSWTLSLNTAKFFANRFDKKGMVYQTDIPKSAILAYFAGEEEVIVDYKQIDKTKLQIVSKGENV